MDQKQNCNTNFKKENIKVVLRVRPLLEHEDIEFWKVDEDANTISTIKYYIYFYFMILTH